MGRPSMGTKSRRIWDEADRISRELGRPAARREVCEADSLSKIHAKTVSTQYGAWKRAFHPELGGTHYTPFKSDAKTTTVLSEAGCEGRNSGNSNNSSEKMANLLDWARLLKSGFIYHCDWCLSDSDQLSLDRDAPAQSGLYAFVLVDEVVYIGTTRRKLSQRMGDYCRGHVGQKTSFRIKNKIVEALQNGKNVRVLFAMPENSEWNGLPVVIAEGLEVGLIESIRPSWNKRGAS